MIDVISNHNACGDSRGSGRRSSEDVKTVLRDMSWYQGLGRAMRCGSKETLRLFILLGVACIIVMISTQSDKSLVAIRPPALRVALVEQTTTAFSAVSEDDTPVVPGFFNTSYLLDQTIKELETNGWVAPRGVGSIARRIYKMKEALRRSNTLSKSGRKPAKHVIYKVERWKGKGVV